MTCLVAIAENEDGISVLGSDSAMTCGQDIDRVRMPKVFELKTKLTEEYECGLPLTMALAVAGGTRVGQTIKYLLELPYYHYDERNFDNDMEWLVSHFIERLRKTLGEHGCKKVDDGIEEIQDYSKILILLHGRVYSIWYDFQVGTYDLGFYAIGSGEDLARGCLFGNQGLKKPVDRVV